MKGERKKNIIASVIAVLFYVAVFCFAVWLEGVIK